MSINIAVPSVGESISEGTIARWLKKEGERVEQGEPLYELETDKATTEIPAPAAGTLHIKVQEGTTVAVGAAIGALEESEAKPNDKSGKPKGKADEAREAQQKQPDMNKPATRKASVPRTKPAEKAAPATPEDEEAEPVHESAGQSPLPSGARMRHELPRDTNAKPFEEPAQVQERNGQAETPAEPAADERETRRPMSAIRQRIAQRLLASQQNTATLTTFNEADLSALQGLRARYQSRFHEKHGIKLGLASFFVKACVRALQAFPVINARIDQNDIVIPRYCNIGVAVSTDKGLMVPVIHGAEDMTFAQIEKAIAELAQKARSGKIAVQDLQDGTFTITNGGVFGSLLSTPILNPPQSAILGLHTIQKRPVVMNDEIVIRPMMYLALSYDHRLIDGRDAVRFLMHVKESVEDPERMLLEV